MIRTQLAARYASLAEVALPTSPLRALWFLERKLDVDTMPEAILRDIAPDHERSIAAFEAEFGIGAGRYHGIALG